MEHPVFDLTGKTILITGGSRGIGAAAVRAVAAAGATVVLHYGKSRAAAEAIQAEVGRARCHLVMADLAEPDAAGMLWRAALAAAARIDVLVNNAGIFEDANIEQPIAAWRAAWARVMQVNLYAPAELCRLAIGHFRERGGGRIINIASRAGHRGEQPDQWPYGASKAALLNLTKTIARGYARDNILAFAIAPGFTETDMVGDLDEADRRRVLGEIPLGTMASAGECGAAVAFLCSDPVRHLTGATLDINGASYVR
jgi:NAD(P)-dependent dehydrogenase (short-subunit alcohol dehydrogenase family)